MNVKHILYIALLMSGLDSFSQNGFVSAGADGSNENGSVSFSVGQVVYQSRETADGSYSLTQGVQQPYTISSMPLPDGLQELAGIQLTAYPNPATDVLNLSIEGIDCKGMTFAISDVKARMQMKGDITSEYTQIDVAQLLAGVYFVEVKKNNQIVRAFKVVKR